MKVFSNKGMFVLEVPTSKRKDIANPMAYRGLTFSTSGSSRDKAVLFSPNPYALADLAESVPEDGTYACKAAHGWMVLRWMDGRWWIDHYHIRYDPPISMFVGPLPGDEPAYRPAREYDL